jgi:nicotinate phosphoribosyltransferase
MSGVYKMVEIETDGKMVPKIKASPDKPSFPGKKQVYRFQNRDVIALDDEPPSKDGVPLLQDVLKNGKLIRDLPPIEESRKYAAECLSYFPENFHDLTHPADYDVQLSDALTNLHKQIADKVRSH